MMIKCITFDLDDTLWECAPVLRRAEKICYHWLAHYYPKITARYNEKQLVGNRLQFMQSHPEQVFNLTKIRLDWLAQLADEFSYPPQMADDAFHIFWLARNEVTLLKDVLESLEQLATHFSLGTISNGNADVNHIGLGKYFDFSVNASTAGVAKPEPEIFHDAMQQAGCDANEILHIGDHPHQDVLGALNAGLFAIWYNPSKGVWLEDEKPTAIIQCLGEIKGQVRLIS
jgi:putative hydrolase of the HAD superfamily